MAVAMPPQKYQLRVVEKVNLAGKFWSVKLEKPEGLKYLAGQYISIRVSESRERRSYSLASWPAQRELELVFDVKPGGLGSGFLVNLEVGQELEVLGPMGRFVIVGGEDKKRLFVGTGSGVVPLRSMIHDLLEARASKELIRLHWGMREDRELFMVKELDGLKKQFPNFSYDIVMSRASETWPSCRGHVQDCLVGHRESWQGWEAYLCGSQQMVLDVAALLRTKGVEKEKIYFEKFY